MRACNKKPAAAYACIPSPEQPDENDTDSFQRVSVEAGMHDAPGNGQAGFLAYGRFGGLHAVPTDRAFPSKTLDSGIRRRSFPITATAGMRWRFTIFPFDGTTG
jgi:hypothetical protein